jgi:polyferredoxin
MNVKPRTPRRNINCVNCGECITACRKELGEDRAIFSFIKNRDFSSVGERKTAPPREEEEMGDLKNPAQRSIIRT